MIGYLIVGIIAWFIFAVLIFPLLVMTIFAIAALFPYILGAVALYLVWKYIRGRG